MVDNNPYQTRQPNIAQNSLLRIPQRRAFARLLELADERDHEREVGIVLPVGCGKSGCITLAPFALGSIRTLVVAPSVQIAQQLHNDFDPTRPDMFYLKCAVLDGPPFPEPVEIRGTTTNRGDLDEADVVITNIHQLQGEDNRWLANLPSDYFDLILFDEGHHSVAATWEILKEHFPNANIVNFSATPLRADGQRMAGRIIFSYPVFQAIQEGYVKRLKAIVLNPTTLRYVRHENDQEIEVSLDEVRRLGEQDAAFRRSIVTSEESLSTIVDASIRELERIRNETGDQRHKIIASALNFGHCGQIVESYRSRGRKADYVHSQETSSTNERIIARLNNHELDVIVQVRKLGEGFDHPYLSVAAVFSIFRNLSPFVQFVGRIMRVIVQNDPNNTLNQGSVVFHAGANVAQRWEDFQEFSKADRDFFDQLLPLEDLNFDSANELEVEPLQTEREENFVEVKNQSQVLLEEIPLLANDEEAMQAIAVLQQRGYSPEDVRRAMELQPVPTTRVRERQAARAGLDTRVKTEVGRILSSRNVNPQGYTLDKNHLGDINFVVLKRTIDNKINQWAGHSTGQRPDFTRQQLDDINEQFDRLVQEAIDEVFNA